MKKHRESIGLRFTLAVPDLYHAPAFIRELVIMGCPEATAYLIEQDLFMNGYRRVTCAQNQGALALAREAQSRLAVIGISVKQIPPRVSA